VSLNNRLERLEGRASLKLAERPEHREARREVRARMSAVLDELAAARREGREPSEDAVGVMEAIKRRRSRES
jgi:hypothetical protein